MYVTSEQNSFALGDLLYRVPFNPQFPIHPFPSVAMCFLFGFVFSPPCFVTSFFISLLHLVTIFFYVIET